MSLQFIIGSSGAGKSYFAYERVIRESMEHPERNYYIIVSGAVLLGVGLIVLRLSSNRWRAT